MWHRQGKVNLTKGSDVVTGVGTNWVENIRVGDAFQGPDGKLYQVINVASNEALAISPAYEGNTATNLNYWVVPVPGYSKTQADRLSLIISKLDGDIVTATEAATQAKEAATQAQQWKVEAAASAAAAQSSELSAAQSADRAEQARDDAVSVVTEGQGSIEPKPGKFPVAGADAAIQQAWIRGLEFELDALRVVRNKLMYGDGPYPVLDLQFQGAKLLDPRITFTRATPDWDWDGKRYEANEPIITDEGLWLWGSRTNLIADNENLTGAWTNTRGIIRRNTFKSPLGKGHTFEKVHAGDAFYFIYIPFTNNPSQIFSAYVRKSDIPKDATITLGFYREEAPAAYLYSLFALNENGELVPTSSTNGQVTDLGEFAMLSSFKTNVPVDGPPLRLIFRLQGPDLYSVDFYCPQLTEGLVPTPGIPTNGSQVTVAASTLEVLADSLSGKFNPNEGTIVWRVGRNNYSSAAGTPQHANMGIIGSGANNGLLAISGNNLVYHKSNGDYQESLAVPATPYNNDEFTVAYTYTKTGVSVSHNGDLVSAEWDASEFLENAVNRLYVSGLTNGYVRALSYYDRALTDEQLQELTS